MMAVKVPNGESFLLFDLWYINVFVYLQRKLPLGMRFNIINNQRRNDGGLVPFGL